MSSIFFEETNEGAYEVEPESEEEVERESSIPSSPGTAQSSSTPRKRGRPKKTEQIEVERSWMISKTPYPKFTMNQETVSIAETLQAMKEAEKTTRIRKNPLRNSDFVVIQGNVPFHESYVPFEKETKKPSLAEQLQMRHEKEFISIVANTPTSSTKKPPSPSIRKRGRPRKEKREESMEDEEDEYEAFQPVEEKKIQNKNGSKKLKTTSSQPMELNNQQKSANRNHVKEELKLPEKDLNQEKSVEKKKKHLKEEASTAETSKSSKMESKPEEHPKKDTTTSDVLLYYNIVTTDRAPGKRQIKPKDYVAENDMSCSEDDSEYEHNSAEEIDNSADDDDDGFFSHFL